MSIKSKKTISIINEGINLVILACIVALTIVAMMLGSCTTTKHSYKSAWKSPHFNAGCGAEAGSKHSYLWY